MSVRAEWLQTDDTCALRGVTNGCACLWAAFSLGFVSTLAAVLQNVSVLCSLGSEDEQHFSLCLTLPFSSLHPNLIFLLGFRGGFNQGQRIAKTCIHCDEIYCSLVLVTEASSRTPGMYFPTPPSPVTDTSSGMTVVIPRESSRSSHCCTGP